MGFKEGLVIVAPFWGPGMPKSEMRVFAVLGRVDVTVEGTSTFSEPVGVRNLLAFPIGDEQAGATPTDTMGIYVFVSSGPTVTGTSSSRSLGCTVTVLNEHGALAFSAPRHPYWHWNERLGAAGAVNDTTQARHTWTFEADTQVTAFQFEMLVSAV